MYNGNGGYNKYKPVGGSRIKPMYLYIAGVVAVLVALYFVLSFLNTSLVMHFSLAAGVLLLLANVRELIGIGVPQRSGTALLNVMIGGGLLCAWLSQFFGPLFWVPAVLLVAIATPLALGRASVYRGYLQTAQIMFGGVRRTISRYSNRI